MMRFVGFVFLLFACAAGFGQTNAWLPAPKPFPARPISQAVQINQFSSFKADAFALRNALYAAPMEGWGVKGDFIWMPSPDGSVKRFKIFETQLQSPEVARKTGVKTYEAQGVDDPWAIGVFDLGRNGFHGFVMSPSGDYFIEPTYQGNMTDHIVFYKHDCERLFCFKCDVFWDKNLDRGNKDLPSDPNRPGANLKTYRLALKGTGEYTAFYGGVPQADNGSLTIMTRINGVYEREHAIRMSVNNLVNYPNAATDPYTNTNGSVMLGQNQTTCDAVPGNANYDIGHVFSTGGGGIAGLQVVGVTGQKARGVTGLPSPIGDPFAIDYVAHEMGHQYGANHTFNSTAGSCGGGNRSASHAYEPGSGSTIMAYAGICSPENVQNNSDDYQHTDSQAAIEAWRNNAGSGGSSTATGNNSPTVNAGADFTIPQDTTFRLTASAFDADGDALTYCWEQFNLGTPTPPTTDESTRPLFRSIKPVASPTRWFPKQSTVINNTFDQFENLPSVNRSMTFRCTVRDNRAGGGNYEWDAMVITVSGAAFSVTSPNTAVNWNGGSTQTITWNVGGGSVAPNVRILLSTDGGNSYFNNTATVLVASTPNDGSENVVLPNLNTGQARIIVEAVGNIFYDMSNVNFAITQTSQIVNPTSYTVVEGVDQTNNIAALLNSDDSWLRVASNTPNASTTILELVSTAPVMTVNRLSFILEHHSNDGSRTKRIQLFNYNTMVWDTVSTTTGTLTDSTVQVNITSNPTQYIDSATRQMKTRAFLQSPSISRTFSRVVDFFDRTVWELSP